MCSPDVPDNSDATKASIEAQERIANRQFQLQEESLDYFKNRQAETDALSKQVTERQLSMAEETQAQGKDFYEYQKSVFRPVEQSMVSQAMRESTPEYYEKYAQEALARTAAGQENAREQSERSLASMGVNPNSGAYASARRGLQINNAAALGGAANQAYDRAEATGWARRADVAGIGKGLVGAGNASYGLASGANSSALGANTSATQTAAGTLGTPGQYAGLGLQGMSGVLGAQTDIYRAQMSGGDNGLMGALGQAFGGWAQGGFQT